MGFSKLSEAAAADMRLASRDPSWREQAPPVESGTADENVRELLQLSALLAPLIEDEERPLPIVTHFRL